MIFLSERAVSLHKKFVEDEKLRFSVVEKTYPEIKGKDARELIRSRNKDIQNAAKLLLDIRCHELYFSSFGKLYPSSERVRHSIGTEATLLYELKKLCEQTSEKYVFVHSDSKRIEYFSGSEIELLCLQGNVLVIDLSEHAYFMDYGFDKRSYVKNLLEYLDLSLLDKKISSKD